MEELEEALEEIVEDADLDPIETAELEEELEEIIEEAEDDESLEE